MDTAITPSTLRKDVYRLLDQVLATRQPLVVRRRGRRVCIVPEPEPGSRTARLKPRPCIKGDPEALVHTDWSTAWTETRNLESEK